MPALTGLLALAPILLQAPLYTLHGDSPNDEFGVAVTIVGDTNRDGYADMLVGAHWDDDNGSNSGSARLVSGADGAVLGTFFGTAANDFFGLSVAGVGDVNHDGFDDFAVGADGSDLGGPDAGLVRVFSGKTHAVLWNFTGFSAGEQFGSSLARVHGTNLLLVGSPASDRAIAVSAADGTIAWTFFGANPGDQFGSALASGRDLDGDDVPDYAIGAPSDDVGGADTGSVTIFSGASGNQIRVLRGLGAGDRFGSSIALLPDADGDGRGELVVGAPRANGPGNDAGAVYLHSGSSGSLIFLRTGEAAGDQFGTAVASMATERGNPEPAFVVGARWNDVTGTNAGAAYCYSALTGSLLRTLRGQAAGDWFGGAVAGGGDVDGNGIGDLAVSARLADVNGIDSGTVEVHGSPLLPSTWYVDAAVPGPGAGTQASPYKSIQYAINRPSTRSGDTILIAEGTYIENVSLNGKVLKLLGSGPVRPTLDGNGAAPVVRIEGNSSIGTRLEGLVICNGWALSVDPQQPEDVYGGGVYAPGSCLELINCTIRDNQADCPCSPHGIGVFAHGPVIRVAGCEITSNSQVFGPCYSSGVAEGGGISASGNFVTIEDCQVGYNSIEGDGGGLSVGGAYVVVRGCSVISNIANHGDRGGGMVLSSGGDLLVEACEIRSNAAYDYGGGIAVLLGQVSIRNCLIDFNRCGNGYAGGGVFAENVGTTIEDCIITRNRNFRGGGTAGPIIARRCSFTFNIVSDDFSGSKCDGEGGGIYRGTAIQCLFDGNTVGSQATCSYSSSAAHESNLVQCTLVANDALPGPDGYTAYDSTLDSCILWGNSGQSVDPSSVTTFSDIEGGAQGVGNIAVDPLFLVPGHNAHLSSLSPCIDAGNPALPDDPDGSRADMGAFPFDPSYCPPPFVYCTAKTNSCGQLPAISFTGSPHAGATSGFSISTTGARAGKSGLVLYSPNGSSSSPFQGGTLCVAPQGLRRSPPVLATGGSGGLACNATFTIDWAAFGSGALGGTPAPFLNALGQRVNVQWWGRDNQLVGALLSDAIQYEVCP